MPTRILLVEDDPLIVDSLTELLAGSGYSVDTADTQQRAIELAVDSGGAHPSSSSCSTSPSGRATGSPCAPP